MPLVKNLIASLSCPEADIIPSSIAAFDAKYGGFRKKSLTFVAARPVSGKTWFMCNCAVNMAKQQFKVLYYTDNISEAVARIHKIAPDVPDMYVEEMLIFNESNFKKLCLQLKPQVVLVDVYLLGNVINKKILRKIKQLAVSLNFAVIVTGTLNRCIDNRLDKLPKISDLLGINQQTGVLETADFIFSLYNPALYIPSFLLPPKHQLVVCPLKMPCKMPIYLELKATGVIGDWEPEILPILN